MHLDRITCKLIGRGIPSLVCTRPRRSTTGTTTGMEGSPRSSRDLELASKDHGDATKVLVIERHGEWHACSCADGTGIAPGGHCPGCCGLRCLPGPRWLQPDPTPHPSLDSQEPYSPLSCTSSPVRTPVRLLWRRRRGFPPAEEEARSGAAPSGPSSQPQPPPARHEP